MDRWFLVRSVDPPEPPVPRRMTVLLDRGPFTLDGERALLREHRVDVLVTKNSGGGVRAAKLAAARDARRCRWSIVRPPGVAARPCTAVADPWPAAAPDWVSSDSGAG